MCGSLVIDGREHLLEEGESNRGSRRHAHTQTPVGDGPGTVRIEVRPAGRTQVFLEHLASLCREGAIMRSGFPRPVAGAELVLEFGDTGHAATPPFKVQRAIAGLVMAVAHPMRPYRFVDEWDVAAPPEAVFNATSDSRTYPAWWRPVYLEVEADGPVAVGTSARHHFKGRLPYHLHTTSVCVELDPPHTVVADVDGDLRGRCFAGTTTGRSRGRWTASRAMPSGPRRSRSRADPGLPQLTRARRS